MCISCTDYNKNDRKEIYYIVLGEQKLRNEKFTQMKIELPTKKSKLRLNGVKQVYRF